MKKIEIFERVRILGDSMLFTTDNNVKLLYPDVNYPKELNTRERVKNITGTVIVTNVTGIGVYIANNIAYEYDTIVKLGERCVLVSQSDLVRVDDALIFKDFLNDNLLEWDKYLTSSEVKNQRWDEPTDYITQRDLEKIEPERWLDKAFCFIRNEFYSDVFLNEINAKWQCAVALARCNNQKILFN